MVASDVNYASLDNSCHNILFQKYNFHWQRIQETTRGKTRGQTKNHGGGGSTTKNQPRSITLKPDKFFLFHLIFFRQIIVSDFVDNFPMKHVSSKYLKSLSVISWIFCGTSPFQQVAIFWDLIMIVMFCLDTQTVSMYIINMVLFYTMYFFCCLGPYIVCVWGRIL